MKRTFKRKTTLEVVAQVRVATAVKVAAQAHSAIEEVPAEAVLKRRNTLEHTRMVRNVLLVSNSSISSNNTTIHRALVLEPIPR